MANNKGTNDYIEHILPTSNEEEMKRMMKELDREQSYREHKCWRQYITVFISVIFVLFQLYATLSGAITAQVLRATHLAFVQLLAFLLFPPTKNSPRNTLPWYDIVLGLIGMACWLYIVVNFDSLVRRSGNNTPLDVAVGIVGILVRSTYGRGICEIPEICVAPGCDVFAAIFEIQGSHHSHALYSLGCMSVFVHKTGICVIVGASCISAQAYAQAFHAVIVQTECNCRRVEDCEFIR